ncbi:hypothetical protein [Devosia sp. 2618]|uniref:hypothetical protein n=1 Tax=Devosia sp. 2618 TaxID=3156454 RepID=UPI0033955E10
MSHNDEHLAHCEASIREAIERWRSENGDRMFTVEQVVADITPDQRAVYLLVHSAEGAEIHLHRTFDEVLFDYGAFSRREWSLALRTALTNAAAE